MPFNIRSEVGTHQVVDRSEFAVECYDSEMHCKERRSSDLVLGSVLGKDLVFQPVDNFLLIHLYSFS